MQTPWHNDFKAFEIMFDDVVEYSVSKADERGTIDCCIFPIENIDPFADIDTDSSIKLMSVLIKKSCWHFTTKQPDIGDVITLPCGKKFKIAEVDEEQNWWKTVGRSIAC